jgi:hypothetical protein
MKNEFANFCTMVVNLNDINEAERLRINHDCSCIDWFSRRDRFLEQEEFSEDSEETKWLLAHTNRHPAAMAYQLKHFVEGGGVFENENSTYIRQILDNYNLKLNSWYFNPDGIMFRLYQVVLINGALTLREVRGNRIETLPLNIDCHLVMCREKFKEARVHEHNGQCNVMEVYDD